MSKQTRSRLSQTDPRPISIVEKIRRRFFSAKLATFKHSNSLVNAQLDNYELERMFLEQ